MGSQEEAKGWTIENNGSQVAKGLAGKLNFDRMWRMPNSRNIHFEMVFVNFKSLAFRWLPAIKFSVNDANQQIR